MKKIALLILLIGVFVFCSSQSFGLGLSYVEPENTNKQVSGCVLTVEVFLKNGEGLVCENGQLMSISRSAIRTAPAASANVFDSETVSSENQVVPRISTTESFSLGDQMKQNQIQRKQNHIEGQLNQRGITGRQREHIMERFDSHYRD